MKSGSRNGLALMRGFLFWLQVSLQYLVIILAVPVVFIFVFCLKKVFIYQIRMFPYLLFKHKCRTLKLSFSILNYIFFGQSFSFCFAEISIFFACKAPSQYRCHQVWLSRPDANHTGTSFVCSISTYCLLIARLLQT